MFDAFTIFMLSIVAASVSTLAWWWFCFDGRNVDEPWSNDDYGAK